MTHETLIIALIFFYVLEDVLLFCVKEVSKKRWGIVKSLHMDNFITYGNRINTIPQTPCHVRFCKSSLTDGDSFCVTKAGGALAV